MLNKAFDQAQPKESKIFGSSYEFDHDKLCSEIERVSGIKEFDYLINGEEVYFRNGDGSVSYVIKSVVSELHQTVILDYDIICK
jgi:hypothetical protein